MFTCIYEINISVTGIHVARTNEKYIVHGGPRIMSLPSSKIYSKVAGTTATTNKKGGTHHVRVYI